MAGYEVKCEIGSIQGQSDCEDPTNSEFLRYTGSVIAAVGTAIHPVAEEVKAKPESEKQS